MMMMHKRHRSLAVFKIQAAGNESSVIGQGWQF
jgi:hypothetical protein